MLSIFVDVPIVLVFVDVAIFGFCWCLNSFGFCWCRNSFVFCWCRNSFGFCCFVIVLVFVDVAIVLVFVDVAIVFVFVDVAILLVDVAIKKVRQRNQNWRPPPWHVLREIKCLSSGFCSLLFGNMISVQNLAPMDISYPIDRHCVEYFWPPAISINDFVFLGNWWVLSCPSTCSHVLNG